MLDVSKVRGYYTFDTCVSPTNLSGKVNSCIKDVKQEMGLQPHEGMRILFATSSTDHATA